MARSIKKSYFTILELLVVLLIISLGMILTGIKVKTLYQEQQFLSDSHKVLNHLSMAQDLMLMLDADVKVIISQNPTTQKTTLWIEIEKPFEDAWNRFIERRLELSAIRAFEFEDSNDKELRLNFSLGRMSKGKLTLLGELKEKKHDQDKNRFEIILKGYPSPFVTHSVLLDSEQSQVDKSQLLYPIEVYKILYEDPGKKKHTKP